MIRYDVESIYTDFSCCSRQIRRNEKEYILSDTKYDDMAFIHSHVT